jgi:hypothetical protein
MNSYLHARISVHHWRGTPEDYLDIHQFIDSSKAHLADVRHRALLHSSFGIFLVEKVFGPTVTNSVGRIIPTREIAEQHIIDDLGRIPPVADWLRAMPIENWMGGPVRRTRFIPFTKENSDDEPHV